MADEERITARLNNIRSVEPILGAMRTISLGSWQAALNRQQRIRGFSERLMSLLPSLLPHLAPRQRKRRKNVHPAAPTVVLVIGSERGLCGAFNSSLAGYVQQSLDQYENQGIPIELATLGGRIRRALERYGVPIAWSKSLPVSRLPGRELASELTAMWLARYEAYELDAVDLIYNAYLNSTSYRPVITRLIPPVLPAVSQDTAPWPPPYIDTDPVTLYTHVVRLWTTTEMYRVLLNAAAAEHSARFQLMEGATQNSRRLIDELTMTLQAARQHAITSEMQELATGAGLVGGGEA
jgi:F-type H+-transporting ATPase subunit gamma